MRILLVEDDELIGSAIVKYLKLEGQAVDWVHCVVEARLALDSAAYEVILLDLGLPDGTGLEILNSLRSGGENASVIILTARDAISDRIAGLDRGADDYMVKPFDLEELIARIRAVQRRRYGQANMLLTHGQLVLNPSNHECLWYGENVLLSNREFSILQRLMEHPNAVFSRSQLEDGLYGWGDEIESNTVEVHIHNLRKKIARNLIKTIRGVGYILGQTA